jgi:hypothetical protein
MLGAQAGGLTKKLSLATAKNSSGPRRRRGRARCPRRLDTRSHEALVFGRQRGQPLGARLSAGSSGTPSGAVGHVQHMGELVDHHVVAIGGRSPAAAHVAPGQHHRAAFHGLAGQGLVVLVHHARRRRLLAPGHHLVGMQHDADEAVVAVQAQAQHRQAGLRGDGHRHVVGQAQAAGA